MLPKKTAYFKSKSIKKHLPPRMSPWQQLMFLPTASLGHGCSLVNLAGVFSQMMPPEFCCGQNFSVPTVVLLRKIKRLFLFVGTTSSQRLFCLHCTK